jgi:exodeoxyribonuclease-3
VPTDRKLYTWWSYRAIDWAASDRGRRLDHIWVTPQLAPRLSGIEVFRDARGWRRPSDHVPVVARIAAA